MSKVSLLNTTPINYIPTRHEESIALLFDPNKQQRAGWDGNNDNELIIDYLSGGTIYGPNLTRNAGSHGDTDWVDSNTDGLADLWSKESNMTATIVTGNGFVGNAQKVEYTSTFQGYLYTPTVDLITGDLFRLKFRYRSNQILNLTNGITGSWPANTGNTASVDTVKVASYTGPIKLRFYIPGRVATDWFAISEVTLEKVENGNHGLAIGDLNATGWGGLGLEFDGIDDTVNLGKPFDNTTNEYPVLSCFWSSVPSGIQSNAISYHYKNFEWGITADEYYGYIGLDNGGSQWGYIGNSAVNHGCDITEWNHYALLLDYENGQHKMYANGDWINTTSSPLLGSMDSSYDFCLLSRNNASAFRPGFMGISMVYVFEQTSVPSDINTLISEIYSTQLSLYSG